MNLLDGLIQSRLYGGANVNGGSSGIDYNAVHYDTADGKNSTEKARARLNIDAASTADLGNKVDVSQGQLNAGKFMVVGSDGNITTVEMAEWQGGSY